MLEFLSHCWELISTPDGLKQLIGWGGVPVIAAIVFAETGLLVGFFLPGDSLLFVAGFLASPAGGGTLSFFWLNVFVVTTAITGDAVGYWVGRKAGPALFNRPDSRFFRRDHLIAAQQFYERHGGKTIVLARFVPILRTFVPVVAGAARMRYRRFAAYNIFGGIGWVTGMTTLGYLLGQLRWVQDNIEKAILLVILLSVSPLIGHYMWARRKKSTAPPSAIDPLAVPRPPGQAHG